MAGAVQLNLDAEQATLLLRVLQESVDNFCDDRPEYDKGDGSYDGELRNQTYDKVEALVTLVQTAVDA